MKIKSVAAPVLAFCLLVLFVLMYISKNNRDNNFNEYLRANFSYSLYEKKLGEDSIISDLICGKGSPTDPEDSKTDWYMNCNTDLNKIKDDYIAIGWKKLDLSKFTMQKYFANFLLGKLIFADAKGDINCIPDINLKNKVDCVVITYDIKNSSSTLKNINFSVFYFKNKKEKDLVNFIIVSDFNRESNKGASNRLKILVSTIKEDENNSFYDIFSYVIKTSYAQGDGSGSGSGDGEGDGNGASSGNVGTGAGVGLSDGSGNAVGSGGDTSGAGSGGGNVGGLHFGGGISPGLPIVILPPPFVRIEFR